MSFSGWRYMKHVVFLASNKVGPVGIGRCSRGHAGRVARSITQERSKIELIAAAMVERVASARGIARKWVQFTFRLCKFSFDFCAPLSRNPISKSNNEIEQYS